MAFLERITRLMSLALVVIGFVAVALMMLHITADVFLRSAFDVAVPATERIVTRYYMIALALLPLGWVEWSKSMISVDAFSAAYGRVGERFVAVFVPLLSAVIYGVFGMATWLQAMEQFKVGAYIMSLDLVIPLWPTYFLVPLALFMAMLVCLVRIVAGFLPSSSTGTDS
ncbi:TRAP transporter small permease [Marinospirillum alkaliphilum]|uniref:TRAP transporter small permease protein n=1 Tax=Marinospirillum alkaliphilum DSM 21637 TaxID=1122209 RepID=A0A1K1VMB0_9GAMM|nr:TRAP transporter small permease [Marinospirillum alkaliphilum]SFX25804.1 Tripartite ATP-independent transporter, DctQ component [Marinospirillum alkaliphilum DSM 21637]